MRCIFLSRCIVNSIGIDSWIPDSRLCLQEVTGIPRDWGRRGQRWKTSPDEKEGNKRRHLGNGTLNRGVRGNNMKKRINWRDFLEENRKLVQENFDHPETREDLNLDWSDRGLQLGIYWKKTDTGKGRRPRKCVVEKGFPCVEEIQ
jgi:hypothetical protein